MATDELPELFPCTQGNMRWFGSSPSRVVIVLFYSPSSFQPAFAKYHQWRQMQSIQTFHLLTPGSPSTFIILTSTTIAIPHPQQTIPFILTQAKYPATFESQINPAYPTSMPALKWPSLFSHPLKSFQYFKAHSDATLYKSSFFITNNSTPILYDCLGAGLHLH